MENKKFCAVERIFCYFQSEGYKVWNQAVENNEIIEIIIKIPSRDNDWKYTKCKCFEYNGEYYALDSYVFDGIFLYKLEEI